MFALIDADRGHGRFTILERFETFEAAEAAARARFELMHFERDADHPGSADMITTGGRIFTIEPAHRLA
jgi:hypothetical protein